jgi:hypothetical protein
LCRLSFGERPLPHLAEVTVAAAGFDHQLIAAL